MAMAYGGNGQTIEVLTPVDSCINETSGLLLLNRKLITHNDSGGKPVLFEFDTLSGKVTRTVYIKGVINKDWEDICADEEHIFIADIGNNNGKRTDLTIYKIKISDYLKKDTVSAETIHFSYGDQKEFGAGRFMTNFDAETLISIGDSLFLFSKNWGNHHTRMYAISKKPGTYDIFPKAEFKAKCLVTSGSYNSQNQEIVLCGYLLDKQFVMRLDNFKDNELGKGVFVSQSFKVPENSSKQIEGIVWDHGYTYFITAEAYQKRSQVLYKLNWKP